MRNICSNCRQTSLKYVRISWLNMSICMTLMTELRLVKIMRCINCVFVFLSGTNISKVIFKINWLNMSIYMTLMTELYQIDVWKIRCINCVFVFLKGKNISNIFLFRSFYLNQDKSEKLIQIEVSNHTSIPKWRN